MIWVVHPGSRIRILTFYPSRIPDPGVKKAPDPGSRIRIRNTVVEEYIKDKDFDCFYESLTNSETCTVSQIKILLRLRISVIGQFLHVITSYWTGEKSIEIHMSWAVYGTFF
jgi:hypothetical protein